MKVDELPTAGIQQFAAPHNSYSRSAKNFVKRILCDASNIFNSRATGPESGPRMGKNRG
jgi:hypothetical protein